jgi:hypothetical protein
MWIDVAFAAQTCPLFLGSTHSLLVTLHHLNTSFENVYSLPYIVQLVFLGLQKTDLFNINFNLFAE